MDRVFSDRRTLVRGCGNDVARGQREPERQNNLGQHDNSPRVGSQMWLLWTRSGNAVLVSTLAFT